MKDKEELTTSRSALYFDGYLPVSKRPTRLERYCRRSRQLNNFFLSYPGGLQLPARTQRNSPLNLFASTAAAQNAELSPPAFAVQAVLDALRGSKYSQVVHLVPQEADLYCARDARNHGGCVITSDSDLLVYNLGQHGSVVFFKEMQVDVSGSSPVLKVLKFTPSQICETFGITHEHGLSTFAFELMTDPHLSLKKLTERARISPSLGTSPDEYWDFLSQYRLQIRSLPPVCGPEELARMDTTVSEFVLQCLPRVSLLDIFEDGDAQDSDLSVDNPMIFLSQSPDKWSSVTSWEISVSIREIAYGVMRLVVDRDIPPVFEFRRLISPTSNGKLVEVPSKNATLEATSELLAVMKQIKAGLSDPALQWIVLSMLQDIRWSQQQNKDSTVLQVLQSASRSGQLDPTSWNSIHCHSQIQGTCYSLRILGQILGLAVRHVVDSPQLLRDLHDELSNVPPLAEFPTVHVLNDLPARIRQAGGLDLLLTLAHLQSPIEFGGREKSKKPNKGKVQKRTPASSSASANAKYRNAFSVLGQE